MPRAVLIILVGVLAACAVAVPSPVPTPDLSAFHPLPPAIAGFPPPGPAAQVAPASRRGAVDPRLAHGYTLGHCGLASPLDFDGNLWNPLGGHDGSGGPLTEEQQIELINATDVRLLFLGPDELLLTTPRHAQVLLRRNAGPRRYSMCD